MHATHRPLSAAIVAGVLLVAACGGDDGAATTTSPPPETTAAPDTAPPETTEPPATDPPETEPPATEAPEPDEPSPVFSAEELAAALPSAADIGDDWIDSEGQASLDPQPNEGPGFGTCMGVNAAARALANDVLAMVQGPSVIGPDERLASTSIYVFADEVDAAGFLEATYQQVDCDDPGVTWDKTQSSAPAGPDEFNGFGIEGFAEGEIWTFSQVAQSDYADDPDGADDVVGIAIDERRELTAFDITFAQNQTSLEAYQRFGNIVVTTWLNGRYDFEGYINLDELVSFEPDVDDLVAYSSVAVPLVLSRLGLS